MVLNSNWPGWYSLLVHLCVISVPILRSVLPHGHPRVPLECSNSVAIARKSYLRAYSVYWLVRFDEQPTGLVDTFPPDVFSDWNSSVSPKSLPQCLIRHIHDFGSILRLFYIGDVLVNVRLDALDSALPHLMRYDFPDQTRKLFSRPVLRLLEGRQRLPSLS